MEWSRSFPESYAEILGVEKNGEHTCFGAWYSQCFKQTEDDDFPVLSVNDLDDSLVDEDYLIEEDQDRFNIARYGDLLLTPFQCSECSSEKLIWSSSRNHLRSQSSQESVLVNGSRESKIFTRKQVSRRVRCSDMKRNSEELRLQNRMCHFTRYYETFKGNSRILSLIREKSFFP